MGRDEHNADNNRGLARKYADLSGNKGIARKYAANDGYSRGLALDYGDDHIDDRAVTKAWQVLLAMMAPMMTTAEATSAMWQRRHGTTNMAVWQ